MTDPKTTLLKLNQNLNVLQEREAKYAGNAPLELLNQISDHQQALDLTRQAITGELNEAEWQESMKPLLLACQNGQVVNIETETYIAGDLITNIYEAPPPPLPPAEAKERHDLGVLLNKVRTFWIEGVLEKSIHNIALIDLGKESQAEAVAHAWEQVLELPDQNRQTLPPDKKISHIFDEMNRALLILGSPGSGKTITLLQLTGDLITQFEQDESFTQPVPVVFNLSTWRKGQPLIEWLVTELSTKYQIPKRIGRPWLENHRLLPLLDGLDEVQEEERAACVEAINYYGEEFGLSGLVVCSRTEEYTSLPVRLKLNGAIRLQPLTLEQVYDYLESAGSRLEALRAALEEDEGLQTLAQTPLTLGIMTLAYQDIPAESLIGEVYNSIEARRTHLFETYLGRMFKRKGQGSKPCSDEQTEAWLSWLAQGMRKHNQGIFLIEQLQPSWLSSRGWVWVYVLASRIISMLFVGLMAGLVFSVAGFRILAGATETPVGIGEWLVIGLVGGLFSGLFLGLIDAIRLENRANSTILKTKPSYWKQGLNIVGVGLIIGTIFGSLVGLFGGPVFGLLIWLAGLVMFGVLFGIRGNQQSITDDIQTVEALKWSWKKALKVVPFGLIGGGIGGLILALCIASLFALDPQLKSILSTSLLTRGVILNLLSGPILILGPPLYQMFWWGLLVALFGGLNNIIVETKTIPNQGIWLSTRNALLTGVGFGLLVGLFSGLLYGLVFGFEYVWDTGLIGGIALTTLAFLWYGGLDVIQHYTLRVILWHRGHTPLNYIGFLNYASERVFLQKVGGGYIFIHRLLLEHFAAMDETAKK